MQTQLFYHERKERESSNEHRRSPNHLEKHHAKSRINKVTPDEISRETNSSKRSEVKQSKQHAASIYIYSPGLVDMTPTRLKPCQRPSTRVVYAMELFSDAVLTGKAKRPGS